jgi:hypothetical protein
MRMRVLAGFAAAIMLTGYAVASPITFSGGSGNLSATASFDVIGGNLVATLTNSSNTDVMVPTDVLTAVFFDVSGNPVFTLISAVLGSGSSVLFASQPAGGVVGGEWAYRSGLSGAPGGATRGISSSGLGLFGPGNLFPGSNLQGPASPDGLQYGLTSAGDNPATGNTPVTGTNALIKNSVVFTLGAPAGFSASQINYVSFQYGTSLTDTSIPGTPEPLPMLLMGSGLLGLGLLRNRFGRKSR